jgi:hypothetical protein
MNETEHLEELRAGMQELKAEMQQLRGDVFEQLRADHQWTIGLIIGIYATSIATLLAILFKSH